MPPPDDDTTSVISVGTTEPLIIKKVKKGGHDHHGGAWKIAYADFVTAMMAFFLLMWLINMTTPEQKQGLADYFSPPHVTATESGAGGVLGGTAPAKSGAQRAATPSDVLANGQEDGTVELPQGDDTMVAYTSPTDYRATEEMRFASAAASIKQAWRAQTELLDASDNLIIDQTDEGLDIQIVDNENSRMFQEGSKYPLEPVRQALAAMAPILQKLPNQLLISGHTRHGIDYSNPRYGEWELSADRANIARSILEEFGLSRDHIHSVVGRASEDPLFPNDLTLAANERLKITVQYSVPPLPLGGI